MGLYQNRIVIKVGTSTLTNEWGKSDFRSFDRLACVLSGVQNMGYEVILVSSGAIAVGKNKLNLQAAESMRHKQAAAAVGQCSIMFLYDKFFGDYDKTIAQILLNADDMEQEEKKENLIHTCSSATGSRRRFICLSRKGIRRSGPEPSAKRWRLRVFRLRLRRAFWRCWGQRSGLRRYSALCWTGRTMCSSSSIGRWRMRHGMGAVMGLRRAI